jgi:hypothetical protein
LFSSPAPASTALPRFLRKLRQDCARSTSEESSTRVLSKPPGSRMARGTPCSSRPQAQMFRNWCSTTPPAGIAWCWRRCPNSSLRAERTHWTSPSIRSSRTPTGCCCGRTRTVRATTGSSSAIRSRFGGWPPTLAVTIRSRPMGGASCTPTRAICTRTTLNPDKRLSLRRTASSARFRTVVRCGVRTEATSSTCSPTCPTFGSGPPSCRATHRIASSGRSGSPGSARPSRPSASVWSTHRVRNGSGSRFLLLRRASTSGRWTGPRIRMKYGWSG